LHPIHSVLCLTAAASLVACSTSPAPAPVKTIPAYLQSATGCAILAGGDIGSRFTDKQVTANWSKINAAITTELHDRLVEGKYKAVKFLVPPGHTRKAEELTFEQLAVDQCNRVLQVAHNVDEDAAGKYFRFDVTLFRAVPKPAAADTDANITVVATTEFKRSYRYPRTQESFENFYTGTFAEKVLSDLVAADALAPLR
jgi:hypothetical protein